MKHQKNWFEWLVFGISLLLVLSIITYLAYQAFQHPASSSPILITESYPDPSAQAPFRYRIVLKNKGGETAKEVKLEIELQAGGKAVSKANLDFPFVPQESKREGWVNFDNGPASSDTIIVKVVSYKRP